MLSDRLWRRRYGADPRIVGTTIQLDGVAHTVVGILPRDFRLALPAEAFLVTDAEMWAPLQFDYGQAPPRNYTFFTVFGRLKPDVTFAQAQAEMNGIALQFRKEFPEHAGTQVRIRAVPLQEDVVKHARPALLILLGAVGAGAGDRVRQRRPPAAGAGDGPGRRVRAPDRARREPLGRRAAAPDRERLLAVAGGALGLMVTTLALGLLRALHPSNLPAAGRDRRRRPGAGLHRAHLPGDDADVRAGARAPVGAKGCRTARCRPAAARAPARRGTGCGTCSSSARWRCR